MLGFVFGAVVRRRADAVRAALDLALCSWSSICWNSLAADFLVWRRRLPGLPVSSVYVLSGGVAAGTLGSVAGGGDAGVGGTLGTGTGWLCWGSFGNGRERDMFRWRSFSRGKRWVVGDCVEEVGEPSEGIVLTIAGRT